MSSQTLLDLLRTRSHVDCDTLDAGVAGTLGPFVDCTSNQAIAFGELSLHRHENLVKQSVALAKDLSPHYPDIALAELAVEVATIQLALLMTPHLTGNSHIQTNPFAAYSTPATISNARRIVSLVRRIKPSYDAGRICIKIPSTWEGLQACKVLEGEGIKTLATTLFTIEQAALAGSVGCTYIAPYVNELRVHFEAYVDPAPNFALCVNAQRYYERHCITTRVLPASLTSIQECMALAGANHITISPPLLHGLAATAVDENVTTAYPSLFDVPTLLLGQAMPMLDFLADEAAFRMAVTRNKSGGNEVKLVQAINIFCDMQLRLEALMGAFVDA